LRTFLYIFSALFFINSIVLTLRRSFTLGLAIMFGLSVGFFILGRYLDFWQAVTAYGAGYYLKCLIMLAVFCYLMLTGYVLSHAKSTVNYNESAIIVLGCGLNSDGTPSHTLQNRLDGCIDYFHNNPDVYIVVTGGLSRHKNQTEGVAMKKYLMDNGIPSDRIITEEKATNTQENFIFSRQLLERLGTDTDNVCYVTNSFHIYRAGVYAKQAGFSGIKALSVKTDAAVFIPAVLREVIAVAMMMFFKY